MKQCMSVYSHNQCENFGVMSSMQVIINLKLAGSITHSLFNMTEEEI